MRMWVLPLTYAVLELMFHALSPSSDGKWTGRIANTSTPGVPAC